MTNPVKMTCQTHSAELAATCSTLGRLHKGEYLIEPNCIESVKDLIRHLKRDGEMHRIRLYLGKSKVLQNDLIHIVKSCPEENPDLFDVTLRLLINLTTPAMLFYGEEVPKYKEERNVYLTLVGYSQDYKAAFSDVEFWNRICGKLTNLFETDWTERSADDGIQIERILMLLRNVLQVPADDEAEKRPENDITVHDKVLWALRQSQILELLLFISSNRNEEQYYLNLLEIFSLILREQNPKLLANSDVHRSGAEKNKDVEDLIKVRQTEKKSRNKYLNLRNFNGTFVLKGVKSLADKDVVCHTSLDRVNSLDLGSSSRKQVRVRRNRGPVESERAERRSTFSVRLFLKEFCLEFLNCSFDHFMGVVKSKLDSGKSLANDQSYYFWALNFFLDFAASSNASVDLIKEFLSTESFHFVHTSMDNAFERLATEKKKRNDWIKRIHLILKAYRSLLETLLWMDRSNDPLIRSISREVKSQVFYVVEYRELILHVLFKYDPAKFSLTYLRDLIETTHLFVKLLEEYSQQTRLVVQKLTRRRAGRKKRRKKKELEPVTREERWEKVKDDVYDALCSGSAFPEIPPFDAALDIPVDDQKGRAMKMVQELVLGGQIREGIGFLRSARQVWPENEFFGAEGMTVEDETMALQEICLADLGEVAGGEEKNTTEVDDQDEEEESEGEEDENRTRIVEKDFDIMDYKKRLVNKKVIEGCGILLKNYKRNSDHTNHCIIKILHRIGWECCMPAMLFQASIFWTLLKVMRDDSGNYSEINTFAVNLLRKFRKLACQNPIVFLELLFWKEHNVALEIQHGYEPYEKKEKPKKATKKRRLKERRNDDGEGVARKGRKKKKALWADDSEVEEGGEGDEEERSDSGEPESPGRVEIVDEDVDEEGEELRTPKISVNTSRILSYDSEPEENERKKGNKGKGSRVIGSDDEEEEESEEEGKGRATGKKSIRESGDEEWRVPGEGKIREVDAVAGRKTQAEVDETERGEKDSDQSNSSLKSNGSSKKRSRGDAGSSSDSDAGSDSSKTKRVRYIDSDSDARSLELGKEKPISGSDREKGRGRTRRRRLAVIDSDSDADSNPFDEK